MTTQKKHIESLFASQTRAIIKFRFPVLLFVLAITFALASQMRHLTIDTSNEGLLRPDDSIILTYNDFRDQFGRDDLLVLAIESETIFSIPFLKKLKKLHEQLEEQVPHIDEITSLINVRDTKGDGDTLLVDDLLAHFPESDQELAALKSRVMTNPLYTNMLISEDGAFTTVLLKCDTYSSAAAGTDELDGFDDDYSEEAFDQQTNDNPVVTDTVKMVIMKDVKDSELKESYNQQPDILPTYLTDKENTAMVHAAKKVVKQFDSEDFRIHMAGSPVVTNTVRMLMMKDMKKFLRMAVLAIGICLFIMFRRVSGTLMPLLIVALTLVSTLGMMAISGIPFRTTTIILPSFLLAVGVGACVHVLSLVYQYLREEGNKQEAIIHAYGHSGLAIVMTSMTTAAGLASFGAAKIAPVADLGVFSAIGILLSLLYTLILLPALLAIFPLKIKAVSKENKTTLFDRFIDWTAEITTSRPRLIVIAALIGIILCTTGIARLHFSHNLLTWLPADISVKKATETIDLKLQGSVALEVILDTGFENGLYDRDLLLALDKLTTDLENFKQNDLFVGKVSSVTMILKEIHRALNENKTEMYKIPDNGALIPQEFLLFENSGSDDLQDVIDSRFQKARITIKVPWRDSLAYVPFIHEIEQRFSAAFEGLARNGKHVEVTTTGIMSLFARILYATIYSAAQSYGIALAVITLMMILLLGNFRMGLIAMIPNIGPILIVMGIMGWIGIPLDMFTMLIASVAIGLAVDDTVHFMYNFKRYYTESRNVRDAVGQTLHTAGRAMLTTSIVLSIGFFIFMFASMVNVFNFGMLTGLAIILALIGDFFLAPALMALVADKMLQIEK